MPKAYPLSFCTVDQERVLLQRTAGSLIRRPTALFSLINAALVGRHLKQISRTTRQPISWPTLKRYASILVLIGGLFLAALGVRLWRLRTGRPTLSAASDLFCAEFSFLAPMKSHGLWAAMVKVWGGFSRKRIGHFCSLFRRLSVATCSKHITHD